MIRNYGPSSVRYHNADFQLSAQTVMSAAIHRGRGEDHWGHSFCPARRLCRRMGRIEDHQPHPGSLSLRHHHREAWCNDGYSSPRSPVIQHEGHGVLRHCLDLTHDQRRSWLSKFPVVISSLPAPKSARGRSTSAGGDKIAIPTQLRTSKLSSGSYKSASQASATCEILIKNHVALWLFRTFTELILLRCRITRFIGTG
jgi:hypothetical protein